MEDLFGGFEAADATAGADGGEFLGTEMIGSGVVFASEVEFVQYPGAVNCVHECYRPKKTQSGATEASEAAATAAAPTAAAASAEGKAPARTYSYTLDPFQAEAVACLERQESVLVAAHTSAGKTTLAEYAISMALRDKQRVIFTSPIKALSNQKFRDFQEVYEDVGLLTGDVSINPNGSIMIMTTEILRSMLYRGSSLVREVGWVIFDEVHYMRDRERGVVWEETMILLPDTVRFVFLSATIPNSREFAEWICRIKHQPCHIIYTDYRPVPLQHYVFPAGGEGVYLVVDEKKKFNEENFSRACRVLEEAAAGEGAGGGSGDGSRWSKKLKKEASGKADLLKVLRLCQEKQFLPLIVFAFSKKECEQNAVILKRQDLTTDTEKQLINEVFANALSALDPEDASLPQIQSMLPLLLRGVAVHHSGLLPILKEVIEILFCENLVKVLFCTETFAMGLNAPAKVVVFSSFSKWDGTERRVISSGEYIQMAGRAGRRGKDDKGLAIVMMSDKIEPETCKNVMVGEALRLDSQFYLSYNMLLNLYRLEGADVGYLVERSFSQFQRNKGVVEVKSKIADTEFARQAVETDIDRLATDAETVTATAALYENAVQLRKTSEEIRDLVTTPKYLLPYLNAGRLVKLRSGQWVVLLRVQEDKQRNTVLNVFDKDQERNVPFAQVAAVATIRANIPETNLKNALAVQLDKIINHERFRLSGLPVMDPVKDMKIPECEVAHLLDAVATLKAAVAANPLFAIHAAGVAASAADAVSVEEACERLLTSTAAFAWQQQPQQQPQAEAAAEAAAAAYLQLFTRRMSVLHSLETLGRESSRSQSLVLREELRAMRRVLRRMNYIDAENILTDKGKLGCEVSSCDEVLLTEMVFNNVFEGLSADETVALLSCLVLDEKSEDTALSEEVERSALGKALTKTREIATSVAEVMTECRVPDFDAKLYAEKIKTQMMQPVTLWLSGKNFKDVMEATSLFEGSVVRVMRRLEELVREVCLAAKAIGHSELENKLIEARKRLRRGIVFAASLYI